MLTTNFPREDNGVVRKKCFSIILIPGNTSEPPGITGIPSVVQRAQDGPSESPSAILRLLERTSQVKVLRCDLRDSGFPWQDQSRGAAQTVGKRDLWGHPTETDRDGPHLTAFLFWSRCYLLPPLLPLSTAQS